MASDSNAIAGCDTAEDLSGQDCSKLQAVAEFLHWLEAEPCAIDSGPSWCSTVAAEPDSSCAGTYCGLRCEGVCAGGASGPGRSAAAAERAGAGGAAAAAAGAPERALPAHAAAAAESAGPGLQRLSRCCRRAPSQPTAFAPIAESVQSIVMLCHGCLCPHCTMQSLQPASQGEVACHGSTHGHDFPSESFSVPAGTQTAALLAQLTQAQQVPGSAAAGLNLSALLGGGSPTPSPAASLALPMGCCVPTSGPADAATPKVCYPVSAAFRVGGTMDPRHTRGVACWAAACCAAPRQPPRLRQAAALSASFGHTALHKWLHPHQHFVAPQCLESGTWHVCWTIWPCKRPRRV